MFCQADQPNLQKLRIGKVYCMLVAQSRLTLCDPVDCSPPGSSVHGILQARVLERVAMPFSRGSFWPRERTQILCIAGRSQSYPAHKWENQHVNPKPVPRASRQQEGHNYEVPESEPDWKLWMLSLLTKLLQSAIAQCLALGLLVVGQGSGRALQGLSCSVRVD